MRRVFVTILLLLAAAAASSHPVLDLIAADRDAGLLTQAEASLHELRYVFAAEQLPERYRVAGAPLLPCATPVLLRAEALRPHMTTAQIAALDGLLPRPQAGKILREYISPAGHFRLSYETSGDAEVPGADIFPPNGVPDFVENCAAYMDSSWAALVDRHGFSAAIHSGLYYEVTFENMDGALGYTTGILGPENATRIAILNNLEGLSWSIQLPDVTPDDIARMVCCHEFKHASQAATSGWSEGDWVELDATWSQDIVFDHENDYRRYLGGGSVGPSCLSHPHIPLDDRDEVSGLYEEMLWEIWMSETWGVEFIQELWERRRRHSTEAMLTSYDVLLQSRGSSLEEGFPIFSGWNFLCGNRAVTNLGYADAADYPAVPVIGVVALFPTTRQGTVDHLAAKHTFVAGLPETGWLQLTFDGEAGSAVGAVVAVRHRDGTGSLHPLPLDDENHAVFIVPVSLDQVDRMGIVTANHSVDQDDVAWAFTVEIVAPTPLTIEQQVVGLELVTGSAGSTPLNLSVPEGAADLVWTADIEADGVSPVWLDLDPTSGTIPAGGSTALTVTAATADLDLGVHTAEIVLTYAAESPVLDPGLEFHRRIPVEMTVTPAGTILSIISLGPNPTRGGVTLAWSGAKAGATAVVTVHDLRGRTLRRTSIDVLSVGATSWTWDGRNDDGRPSPGGRYLLKVSTPTGSAAGSVVLIR